MNQLVQALKNKIVVAIDSPPGDPFGDLELKVAMARAAEVGGAGALRVGGSELIKAVSAEVTIPVIGYIKLDHPDYSIVRVTPTFKDACLAVESGVAILALELTGRVRSDGLTDQEIITKIKNELDVPVIADTSTFDEAVNAEKTGVDMVTTTLVGYTPQSKRSKDFDFDLLARLCKSIKIPVIAEGHIASPAEAQKAVSMGAYCVVVGSMISRPHLITKKYTDEILKVQK